MWMRAIQRGFGTGGKPRVADVESPSPEEFPVYQSPISS